MNTDISQEHKHPTTKWSVREQEHKQAQREDCSLQTEVRNWKPAADELKFVTGKEIIG